MLWKPAISCTWTCKDIGSTLLIFSVCTLEVHSYLICILRYISRCRQHKAELWSSILRSSEKLISYPCRWNCIYRVAFKRYIDGRPNLCRWRGNRFSNSRNRYFSKIAKLLTRTNWLSQRERRNKLFLPYACSSWPKYLSTTRVSKDLSPTLITAFAKIMKIHPKSRSFQFWPWT